MVFFNKHISNLKIKNKLKTKSKIPICYFDENIINNELIKNNVINEISEKLTNKSMYIGCAELEKHYRHKHFKNQISFIFHLISYRIIPKLKILNFLLKIFKINYLILSKAEIIGRLYYSGFEVVDYIEKNNKFFFCAEKKYKISKIKPSKHIIYSMPRIGRYGKIIYLFKFRTMYSYSEFIYEFIQNQNGTNIYGKIKNDYRITNYGKIMRKYWIDEIPQLYNFLKGEINLVGPRAVSKNYYNNLPKDIKKNRLKVKPGFIPPSICFNLHYSEKSMLEAERLFYEYKKNNPITCTINLLFFAFYNAIFKKIRGN